MCLKPFPLSDNVLCSIRKALRGGRDTSPNTKLPNSRRAAVGCFAGRPLVRCFRGRASFTDSEHCVLYTPVFVWRRYVLACRQCSIISLLEIRFRACPEHRQIKAILWLRQAYSVVCSQVSRQAKNHPDGPSRFLHRLVPLGWDTGCPPTYPCPISWPAQTRILPISDLVCRPEGMHSISQVRPAAPELLSFLPASVLFF